MPDAASCRRPPVCACGAVNASTESATQGKERASIVFIPAFLHASLAASVPTLLAPPHPRSKTDGGRCAGEHKGRVRQEIHDPDGAEVDERGHRETDTPCQRYQAAEAADPQRRREPP